jgi:uncharacterized protein (DUF1501 family)
MVCVLLFGGNDSNNTMIPNRRCQLHGVLVGPGAAAVPLSAMAPVTNVSGAPYGFHTLLQELASLFSSRELAVPTRSRRRVLGSPT